MSHANHHRVLIVDDSAEDRYIFRRYLAKCHTHTFDVIESGSGADGIGQCYAEVPDCILLDYNLPDLNGVEFLAKLHAEFSGHAPPVIMLTGQGSESLAVEAMKAGVEDYLVKGLAQNRICQAVSNAIESMALRRQVAAQALEVEALSAERGRLIAELEQRADTMAQMDRRKDEFLAILAHELRNPLAPIRSAAQILKQMYPAARGVEQVREVVERQVEHLTRLIDDLMDVARITSGKVTLKCETIPLAKVIAHTTEICQPLFQFGGHTFRVVQPENDVFIHADPVRVVQILANIIGNACKYTFEPGQISLNVSVNDEEVVFVIHDPGVGMEENSLTNIFGLFTQLEPPSGRLQAGLGIGLSLAKKFVELHGGTIYPTSAGIGKGSEFTVTLPVVVRPEKPGLPAASVHVGNERPLSDSHQILVVDDNEDGAEMLKLLFESEGVAVATAYNGVDAVAFAQQHMPEVIVMDISMPGMDGYETVSRIRALPGGAEVVAIALSGWGHDSARASGMSAGFDDYLVKPVDFEKLKEILQRMRS